MEERKMTKPSVFWSGIRLAAALSVLTWIAATGLAGNIGPGAPAASAPPAEPGPAIPTAATPAPGETAAGPSGTPDDEVALPPESAMHVSPDGTFELHMQSLDLRGVLRQLSDQSRRNIIVSEKVKGTVTVDMYGVTFEEALQAVLHAAGMVAVEKGKFLYVYTAEEFAALKVEQKTEIRVFPLCYLTAEDAKALVEKLLSREGSISTTPKPGEGIVPSKEQTGGKGHASDEIIIVRDTPEVLDRVTKVLKSVDVRPRQVLVEATILAAELNEDNFLGVDLQYLGGVDFQTFGMVSDLTGITAYTPPPLTVGVPVGGVKDFNKTQGRVGTSFGGNRPADMANPMTIGVISNNIAMFIQALEQVTDVTVLANPKLLVVNKQRGEMLTGQQRGYITTTVTETSAVQTVEFLETGTRLVVRPFIGEDGFIRMEIHPEDSTGTVAQVGGENGPVLPNKTTTEVTSNVMVRDGKTVVIGGLFREQTDRDRSQVPWFGNLPWVGPMFRSSTDRVHRQEVIILITPHIINEPSAEAVGEQAKLNAERYRIGARLGLPVYSNSRLADSNMASAKQALAEGKLNDANWYCDLALSMEPHRPDAIALKEQLTHKALWAGQEGHLTTRYLVMKMIMAEMGKPAGMVLPPTRALDNQQIDEDVRRTLGIGMFHETPPPPEMRPITIGQPTTAPAVAPTPTPSVEPAPTAVPHTMTPAPAALPVVPPAVTPAPAATPAPVAMPAHEVPSASTPAPPAIAPPVVRPPVESFPAAATETDPSKPEIVVVPPPSDSLQPDVPRLSQVRAESAPAQSQPANR